MRVLERAERIGKKILISGGGRCNFTNLHAGPENYLSGQPAFCRSALARYQPSDFIALVERHGIAYHEKRLGQLFCDGSSREIVEMLAAECREANVRIETGADVREVSRGKDGVFVVRAGDREWRGRSLVVAAGGLSFPKLGGSDVAHTAFGGKHFHDLARAAVAEKLAESLFVVGDAVPLDERDEIRRLVTRQRRSAKSRLPGKVILRPGVQVREVAASTPGDQDFLADAFRPFEHTHPPSSCSGDGRAHQPRRPRAKDQHVVNVRRGPTVVIHAAAG